MFGRNLIAIIAVALITLTSSSAFASLSIVGNSVYDDVTKQYWVSNLNLFTNKTYIEQIKVINQLNINNYNGQSGWHVANTTEATSLFRNTSLSSMFNPTYQAYDPTGNMTGFGAAWPQTSLAVPPVWAEPFISVSVLYGRYTDNYPQIINGRLYYSLRRYSGETYGVSYYAMPNNIFNSTVYPDRNAVIDFNNTTNIVADNLVDPLLGAWVTTSVVPTPIPPAFLLMGSGLAGLVGLHRKKIEFRS
jgi:hypothetical protein